MHHLARPILILFIALAFAMTGSAAHAMPAHVTLADCSARVDDRTYQAPAHHAGTASVHQDDGANASGKHCAAMTCPFTDAGLKGAEHDIRLPVSADFPLTGAIPAFSLPETFYRPPNA